MAMDPSYPARYVSLTNNAAVVARMHLHWQLGTETGIYEPEGYHDVLLGAERTIDMLAIDAIPAGATVSLYVEVVMGEDPVNEEKFMYKPNAQDRICYELNGTAFSTKLRRYSPIFAGE